MSVTPYTKVSSASLAGLVTDGNALLNTEQSNLDEANYEILRDGSRRRRRPIIQETEGDDTYLGTSIDADRSAYMWQTPSFRDNVSILCEENNRTIRFYLIDHDTEQYVRKTLLEDRLNLDLWGRGTNLTVDLDAPCTYAEGNGALYIFNTRSGTIKVELQDDNSLRMSPVGTWVRDYKGATEPTPLDYRKPRTASTAEYAPGLPFFADVEPITSELGEARAYNLSNSGWDAQSVAKFMTESDVDLTINIPWTGSVTLINNQSLWPATTDRYLTGRTTSTTGESVFSYSQLVQAKEDRSKPPMGSRIGPTEFAPAGTLVGLPSDMTNNTTFGLFNNGNSMAIDVTFDQRQTHVNNGNLATYAAFIHSMVFTCVRDGRTYQGGFSGILPATISNDGKTLEFNFSNSELVNYTNITIVSMYMHPSPEYFPHMLENNGNGYDYRRRGRRPLSGAFFAGRLFQTADNHNRIYFSQVLDTSTETSSERGVTKETLCFAEADPTDGDDNAVVATDGGYINMSDSGTHYGLVALGDSLLVMTDRGIWAIRPGSDGIFTASNYSVTKVVNVVVLGSTAWTTVGDQIHVATDEGIFALSIENTSFGNTSIRTTNITEKRILKHYNELLKDFDIPEAVYDSESQTVRWLFKTKDWEGKAGQPVLSFSLHHNAWYKYVLGTDGRVLNLCTIPYSAKSSTHNKFRYLIGQPNANGSLVYLTGWGVEVEFSDTGNSTWIEGLFNGSEKFSDFRLASWQTKQVRDPVPAYMLTNHILPGEGLKWSQINYLIVHNRNVTEQWIVDNNQEVVPSMDGGTLVSVQWDWKNQSVTGKWTRPQQSYRYRRNYLPQNTTTANNYGEPVLVHKLKMRGRGREFRIYFQSDGHKDSHLEGWAYQGYVLDGV